MDLMTPRCPFCGVPWAPDVMGACSHCGHEEPAEAEEDGPPPGASSGADALPDPAAAREALATVLARVAGLDPELAAELEAVLARITELEAELRAARAESLERKGDLP